jgi:hypothetical protein
MTNAEGDTDNSQRVGAEGNLVFRGLEDPIVRFLENADDLSFTEPSTFGQDEEDAQFTVEGIWRKLNRMNVAEYTEYIETERVIWGSPPVVAWDHVTYDRLHWHE